MRVVVTGATGNIGTSVLSALAVEPRVDSLVGLARRLPGWHQPKTSFVAGDVRSADLAGHYRGADTLVQLSWAFQSTHRPLETWDANVIGTIRSLAAAADAGVRTIVYASSVGAYSPGAGRTVDESWPTHSMPIAAYGREKAYLERVLDAFELRHPEVRVVRMRPSFVFKRASGSEQRRIFAGQLLPRSLVRPGRMPVLPLPAGLRFQAVHSDDLADAVRRLILSDVRGAFNIAADPVIDAAELRKILQAPTVPVPQIVARAAVGTAWKLHLVRSDHALLNLFLQLPVLDTSRIRAETGWEPVRSGAQAISEMLRGMAEAAGLPTAPLHPDHPPVP
jgi:UDP-glucose 4-epimerase